MQFKIENMSNFGLFLISMPGGGELMRGIGQGIREFNDAKTKVKSEIQEGMKTPAPEKKEEK